MLEYKSNRQQFAVNVFEALFLSAVLLSSKCYFALPMIPKVLYSSRIL